MIKVLKLISIFAFLVIANYIIHFYIPVFVSVLFSLTVFICAFLKIYKEEALKKICNQKIITLVNFIVDTSFFFGIIFIADFIIALFDTNINPLKFLITGSIITFAYIYYLWKNIKAKLKYKIIIILLAVLIALLYLFAVSLTAAFATFSFE